MLEKDFKNSKKYLSSLIDCHKKDNILYHLRNSNEDIIETIKRLYQEDNFQLLFDPIFNKIDNDEISIKSKTYLLCYDYNGMPVNTIWLNLVRTNNFFYVIVSCSKEYSYANDWFKNEIKHIDNFELEDKAEKYFYKKIGIDLNDYIVVEEEEIENYDKWDITYNINIDGDYWYYLVKKDATMINQNDDEEYSE